MAQGVSLIASDAVGSAQSFYNDAVTTAVQVKASRGQVYGLKLINTTAAAAYLQVFFKPAAQVVLGTTVPDLVVPLAANESVVWPMDTPAGLGGTGTGITIAGTTTPGGLTGAALKVSMLFF